MLFKPPSLCLFTNKLSSKYFLQAQMSHLPLKGTIVVSTISHFTEIFEYYSNLELTLIFTLAFQIFTNNFDSVFGIIGVTNMPKCHCHL